MTFGPISNLEEWRAKAMQQIGERMVVLGISGGKDSTSMALLLKEAGIPFRSIFLDTGWEHPKTKEYVQEYLPNFIGEIKILGVPGGMSELIRKRGGFPSPGRQFCTMELKVRPLAKYFSGLSVEPINTVGIRQEESVRRAKYPEWEYSSSLRCDVWRPILKWKLEDLVWLHSRHNVRPNPLYLQGFNRVGCWPCIFASKHDLKLFARHGQERVQELRILEAEMKKKKEKKLGHPVLKGPTWFARKNKSQSIDEAIRWANGNSSSSEPYTMPAHLEGCMRWGLCDHSKKT